MYTCKLSKYAINAIRRSYIKGDLKAHQIAKKLNFSYATVYHYCKAFDEIKRLHPDKLSDMNFFIFEKRKVTDKSENYVSCLAILPELIKTDTNKKLSGHKLYARYHALYPDGYSLTHFQTMFRNWKKQNDLNAYSVSKITCISDDDTNLFNKWRRSANHTCWQRAVAILESFNGKSLMEIADKVEVNVVVVERWVEIYKTKGIDGLKIKPRIFHEEVLNKISGKVENVIKLIHQSPKLYGINRTSWTREDLSIVYQRVYGAVISITSVGKYLKKSGYNFKKAQKRLTSPDPKFHEKLDKITKILTNLGPDDRFFSIDEMGPVWVRLMGGWSQMKKDDPVIIAKKQKSKGSLIVTAAVELTTNQVTHFYSLAKNTTEMTRLIEVLLVEYKAMNKIYLSWDAASWHRSKILKARINDFNSASYRQANQTPFVELAPLPVGAQFLNVIESVFSGLAKAVIHNSDYPGVPECKAAIDRHFAERNAYFLQNPKKAGKRVWGKEIVKPVFAVANNCKDPRGWG